MENAINKWLTNMFTELISFFISLFTETLDLLDTNINIINTWTVLFIGLAGTFLVCIVLFRSITSIFGEAYGSDVAVSHIVLDAVKSSAAIPIMAFAQGLLQTQIFFPLLKYFFSEQSIFTAEAITGTTQIGTIVLGTFALIIFLLFFAIVLGVFFVKMCRFYVDIIFADLLSVWAAVSIATESSNYAKSWWQSLLKLHITLLAQIISLSLMIYGVTHFVDGLQYLMIAIGGGILIINPPTVLQDMWASSGVTRGLGRGAMAFVRDRRQRSLFSGGSSASSASEDESGEDEE